jgi:exodeoxyribonuclease-3
MEKKLRIATWNINSVRARILLVERFLKEWQPDVLCLQETKVANELFPREAFDALGYTHHAIHGQKGYHGVATLSKLPLADISSRRWTDAEAARHVTTVLPGGIELHNFYVPAGGDIADPVANPKFADKLAFLNAVINWGGGLKGKAKRILVGDLNIAPLEHDVWSHKQLLKVVSHTPVEVDLMMQAMKAHDWIDAARHFVPADQKLYSWWSYRAADWDKADKGRRLDHVWVTPALKPALAAHETVRAARGWDGASDHVPVVIDFKF